MFKGLSHEGSPFHMKLVKKGLNYFSPYTDDGLLDLCGVQKLSFRLKAQPPL